MQGIDCIGIWKTARVKKKIEQTKDKQLQEAPIRARTGRIREEVVLSELRLCCGGVTKEELFESVLEPWKAWALLLKPGSLKEFIYF